MEWDNERMNASVEHAIEAARRMIREQGDLDGMLATLHPVNDSGFTVFGFAVPDKPEDRDLIAEMIRGVADELEAIMVTLAVSASIQIPGNLDNIEPDKTIPKDATRSEFLMVTASHRELGESYHFERIQREASSVRFDAVSPPAGLAMEDCFVNILSSQRPPISTTAREQARALATQIRLGRAGNDGGQARH